MTISLVKRQENDRTHLTCQQQAGIGGVWNLIGQTGCVGKRAGSTQLAERSIKELACQRAAN